MDMVHRAAEQTDPMPELERLCDEIGPRLTGSAAAQTAERQVVEYMRKIGHRRLDIAARLAAWGRNGFAGHTLPDTDSDCCLRLDRIDAEA